MSNHLSGDLIRAEKDYRAVLRVNPNNEAAVTNLATLCKSFGNLKESADLFERAIKINQSNAAAMHNYANLLQSVGFHQRAVDLESRAISLNPGNADQLITRGESQRQLGRLQEAVSDAVSAINLSPNHPTAFLNLGVALQDAGRFAEALAATLKLIQLEPTRAGAYANLIGILKDCDYATVPRDHVHLALRILLDRKDVRHTDFFGALNRMLPAPTLPHDRHSDYKFTETEAFRELVGNEDLWKSLKLTVFHSLKWEEILTRIRREVCLIVAEGGDIADADALEFLISLAQHCFLNEFVFSYEEDELEALRSIEARCLTGGELSEFAVAVVACYRPLVECVDLVHVLRTHRSNMDGFNELLDIQVREPLQERETKSAIRSFAPIGDEVSLKVRDQYERNPYPRWRYAYRMAHTMPVVSAVNAEIWPNRIDLREHQREVRILIAGCGTGQQLIAASRYANAKITAIDLSASSLAYAARKLAEAKIDNVDLIQMDILDLPALRRQFDVIECGGVLHHMDMPSRGLSALLSVLRPDGYLKLGLYSDVARRDIAKARGFIEAQGFAPSPRGVREFREAVISGRANGLERIAKWGDFYSMSECLDLCFHVQEHRFTVPALDELLAEHGLGFLGFFLPASVKRTYGRAYPHDAKQVTLDNWAEFEMQHPDTFEAMYQFWVTRK